jgi:hypothetical protein
MLSLRAQRRGEIMNENMQRVVAMQTIEEVKGQMGVLQHILDDIQTVLAAKHDHDETLMPIAPEQIGALIRELEVLRLRIDRLTSAAHVPEDANW